MFLFNISTLEGKEEGETQLYITSNQGLPEKGIRKAFSHQRKEGLEQVKGKMCYLLWYKETTKT